MGWFSYNDILIKPPGPDEIQTVKSASEKSLEKAEFLLNHQVDTKKAQKGLEGLTKNVLIAFLLSKVKANQRQEMQGMVKTMTKALIVKDCLLPLVSSFDVFSAAFYLISFTA